MNRYAACCAAALVLLNATSVMAQEKPAAAERSPVTLHLTVGPAAATGQLGEETSMGWHLAAGAMFSLRQKLMGSDWALGFNVNHARFPNADTMPDDFSASLTTLTINNVFSFGDDTIKPFVEVGAGLSRKALNFGDSSSSEWDPAVSAGAGALFEISNKLEVGVGTKFIFCDGKVTAAEVALHFVIHK